MNDHEVKTSVSEEDHDDLLVTARHYGFKTRAELLRWMIKRELAWSREQIQFKRLPGIIEGRD